MARALFPTGRVVATPAVLAVVDRDYLLACLARHLSGDWGCCGDDDKAANRRALKDGERLLSAYPIDPARPSKGWGDNTIWVITERDRSATTFLLPNDYF